MSVVTEAASSVVFSPGLIWNKRRQGKRWKGWHKRGKWEGWAEKRERALSLVTVGQRVSNNLV